MNKTHLTKTRFSNLELSDLIIKSLKLAGYTECTPIQDKTLPLSLRGKDIAGQAQTGTGKTAAFLLATFQHLMNDESEQIKNPRALILAPTRELAIQIHKDAVLLGKLLGLKYALIYGGTDYKKQQDSLKGSVDIVIGTPGRVIDFQRQNILNLNNIQVTVMDEADRMFDLGFIKDIRYLLRRMPPPEKRLNLLFSATLSYKVTELAYEHMNSPELVKIEQEEVTSKAITQSAFCPSNDQKIPLLIGLLKKHQPERSIVFVNTKRCAEQLEGYLTANDYKVAVLSGDVPQDKRQRLLNDFQQDKVNLMIATDVAARGLHIPAVSHVINYDLPQDVEDYVHRIGRTARFGTTGIAFSFICEDYAYSMPDIEDYIGEKITVSPITDDILATDLNPPAKRPPRKSNYQGKKPHAGNTKNYKPRNSTSQKPTENKTPDNVTNKALAPENPQ